MGYENTHRDDDRGSASHEPERLREQARHNRRMEDIAAEAASNQHITLREGLNDIQASIETKLDAMIDKLTKLAEK